MQAVRLKIWDSHLTCQVENKCLNVRERIEVVQWIKRWFPSFPSIFLLLSLLQLPLSLRVCFIFINPFSDLQWNSIDMFGLVLLIETCIFYDTWINYGTVSLTISLAYLWNVLTQVLMQIDIDCLWISAQILSTNRHEKWNPICNSVWAVVASVWDWRFHS